jgi:hypothetical protein
MRFQAVYISLLVLSLINCGKGGDEVLPVPVPLIQYIRKSTPSSTKQKTVVVGLPQAVKGQGKVHLTDTVSAVTITVSSTDSGSFFGLLPVGKAAALTVVFENEKGLSNPVALINVHEGITPELVLAYDTDEIVSSPDNQGLVTVSNDAGAEKPLLLQATPNSELIVANATNGEAVSSQTDTQGRFTVKLPGHSGDKIHLMLADASASDLTSDFLMYSVP